MEPSPNPPVWRILLVEDHSDTRRLLQQWLAGRGHVVLAADCMMTALAMWERDAGIQLMISDIGLPDGNGWQLLERVSASRPPGFPAIAMSGYNTPDDRAKSRVAGFATHLVKPFRLVELAQAIRTLFPSSLEAAVQHGRKVFPEGAISFKDPAAGPSRLFYPAVALPAAHRLKPEIS